MTLETNFGGKWPLELSEMTFCFQMEALLGRCMPNAHGKQNGKDSLIMLHGSNSAVPQISWEVLTLQDEVGKNGFFSSCYTLLVNIFLFYLLSFFNTALRKPTPKCPIIENGNTLLNQIKKTRQQNSLFSCLPAPAALKG